MLLWNKTLWLIKDSPMRAGALVLWLCVMNHVWKVVSLNPSAVYWMDIWTFFTLICCKNCFVSLKRPKIKEKVAGVGPFKNSHVIIKLWFAVLLVFRTKWFAAPMTWIQYLKESTGKWQLTSQTNDWKYNNLGIGNWISEWEFNI